MKNIFVPDATLLKLSLSMARWGILLFKAFITAISFLRFDTVMVVANYRSEQQNCIAYGASHSLYWCALNAQEVVRQDPIMINPVLVECLEWKWWYLGMMLLRCFTVQRYFMPNVMQTAERCLTPSHNEKQVVSFTWFWVRRFHGQQNKHVWLIGHDCNVHIYIWNLAWAVYHLCFPSNTSA